MRINLPSLRVFTWMTLTNVMSIERSQAQKRTHHLMSIHIKFERAKCESVV